MQLWYTKNPKIRKKTRENTGILRMENQENLLKNNYIDDFKNKRKLSVAPMLDWSSYAYQPKYWASALWG